MSPGWIYIISNPSMPNFVKIGRTTRRLHIRIKELNRDTAVPTPFKIEYAFYVTDCKAIEVAVYDELRHVVSANAGKGFFSATPEEAKEVVEQMSGTTAADLNKKSVGEMLFLAVWWFFAITTAPLFFIMGITIFVFTLFFCGVMGMTIIEVIFTP